MTQSAVSGDGLEDLDFLDSIILTPGPEQRGRSGSALATPALTFEYVRDLTDADIALLSAGPRSLSAVPFAQRLSALTFRHHSAARLIADGHKLTDVALATGYSTTYLSLLRSDPAFKELVAHYGEQKEQAYLDVHSRLGALGMTAVDHLQARLDKLERLGEDDAEDLIEAKRRQIVSNKELREIAALALDRSIAPSKGAKGGQEAPAGASGAAPLVVNLNFSEPPKHGAGSPIIEVEAQVVPTDDGVG